MARQCKILNVAEKNDAAKELSNVMARGRVHRVSVLHYTTFDHYSCGPKLLMHIIIEGRILQIQQNL